jgi:hypothetical protein
LLEKYPYCYQYIKKYLEISLQDRVIFTIGREEVADRERNDIPLGHVKAMANTFTADLIQKAKNVASKCPDQPTQNRVR